MALLLASFGQHGLISHTVELAVTLLVIAAATGVAVRFVKIPYTVALVVVGLIIAVFELAPREALLNQELVLILFLPPLLFQAGLHLDLEHLRRVWVSVALFALPGVLVSTAVVAATISLFLPEALRQSHPLLPTILLFGAILATTDPISVLAAFKTAGVPEKLKTIVEGESLFNDGTGVVLFVLLVGLAYPYAGALSHGDAAAATGEAATALATPDTAEEGERHGGDAATAPVHDVASAEPRSPGMVIGLAVLEFLRVTGVGTLIGILLGLGGMAVLRRIEDHTLENAITIALVWGGFLLAEKLHGSGVFSVVIVGLLMGNYGKHLAMSEDTRLTVQGFWDAVDFVVNSFVFLLIGTELQEIGSEMFLHFEDVILPALATIAAIFIARALVVYPVSMLRRRQWQRNWNHVMFWSGLKGSIPLALVLGMTPGPLRSYFLPIIFVVVLFSLVVQGATMPWVIRGLGVGGRDVDLPGGGAA